MLFLLFLSLAISGFATIEFVQEFDESLGKAMYRVKTKGNTNIGRTVNFVSVIFIDYSDVHLVLK